MYISKIKVKNFRSIREAEISFSNFNVFVGQNNHGKTNFFEALDWFFSGPKKGEGLDVIRFRGASRDEEVSVEVEFTGAKEGAQKMKNETNKTKIEGLIGENNVINVRRTSTTDLKKRTLIIDGEEKRSPVGFDSALNDFLPSFEYVSTLFNPMDFTKFKTNTPIGNMLSGVLAAILEQDEKYAEFKKKFEELFTDPSSRVHVELENLSGQVKTYLIKQFPDCEKVVFSVSAPLFEDLLKNFEAEIDDGVYTGASEKGDGMQRALMLAIIQAYADFRREHEETSKYFLFFIDEGELHLHPMAQRKLKNALFELANKGDQIFLNTHSSVLISDDVYGQTIFRVEKTDKKTSITPIQSYEKLYIVYDLLGGSPADLLLPKNFLVVEGKSEVDFLTRVIARYYPEKPYIQVIPADGDMLQAQRSFSAIAQIFKPLETSIYRDRTVIFVDKQSNATQRDNFLNSHTNLQTNGQFYESTEASIEEYYPTTWKKTADEARKMSGELKLNQAKSAGEGISKDDFEKQMSKMFEALNKCWDLAYS